jgi:hypothetical protein
VLLDRPEQMADPKTAFEEDPFGEAEVHLTFTGQGRPSMFGGEPDTPHEKPGEEFAKGHYEQLVQATGTIRVDDREWEIDGHGLRDHSWGPRFWQSPWWYRWLTANFGDDFGFVVSVVTSREGKQRIGGMVLRDGEYEHITHAEIDTTWEGDDVYHRALHARATTDAGTYEITGKVMNLIPLRNRRTTPDGDQLLTRISEGLTEWQCNGRTGYGLSEYLDQIVDGKPVGAIS